MRWILRLHRRARDPAGSHNPRFYRRAPRRSGVQLSIIEHLPCRCGRCAAYHAALQGATARHADALWIIGIRSDVARDLADAIISNGLFSIARRRPERWTA